MNHCKPFIWLSIFVVGTSISSCDSGESNAPGGPKAADQVDILIIEGMEIENTIKLSGSINPNEEISIRSEVSGRIERLSFEEGSRVNKGSLLIKIDDSEWQAQLQKAQSQLDLAKKDEFRKKQLLEAKGISLEEYDQSVTRTNELKAEVALIQSKIRNASVYAPFSGFIGLRYASEGAYVNQGQILALLVQSDPVKIEFGVPQRYASFIREGMSINFKMDGSEQIYEGVIYAFEPRIDEATRTLRVRAKCSNKDGKLIPGSFAEISLVLEKLGNALMIPTSAIVPQINGQKVFVLKNGVAESRAVETGIRTENLIQITKGLSIGDSLLTTSLLSVKDGSPLQVRNVKTHAQ